GRGRVGGARPVAAAPAGCRAGSPALPRGLVRGGGPAGAPAPVLGRLAASLERPAAIRARLRAALAYPAVMALAVTAVLIFLLTWVLPQMAQLFAETGAPLPLPTRALLLAGTVASRTWAAWLLALAVGAVALRSWLASRAGRARFDAWILGLPAVGRLVGAAALARAAPTPATLPAGRVRLAVALDPAAARAGNARIAAALTAARDAVRQGQPLAPALRASGVVPASVLRLVATGERSGGLTDALTHAAEGLDTEVERDITAATALVEPALVLAMGATVLILVLSVLVPLLRFVPLPASCTVARPGRACRYSR